jgi:VWFA-related protein
MCVPSCFIATQAFRQAVHLLTLVVMLSTSPQTGVAQTRQLERSFPVAGKPKITVLHAQIISIDVWDKNEVAIVAKATDTDVLDDDIKIQSKEDKLEIACSPSSKKAISINLRLPRKSVIEMKIFDYKVEIKEPSGVIKIDTAKDMIQLDVPIRAELDLREAAAVTRIMQNNSRFTIASNSDQRFGGGPPYIKVFAKGAQVLLTNGPIKSVTSSRTGRATVAARTIAGKNGSMSQALRRSHPHLSSDGSANGEPTAAGAKETDAAIKLETQLVNLHVTVTDRSGKAITGLKQNDFSIYEEDGLQGISFFASEQTPFNLVLLIDLSGSVKDKIDLIKEAALHFLEFISPQDSVAVITFTTDVNVVSHLTNDREKLRERIRKLERPEGGTAFYDALGYVLAEELSKVKGERNAVIAITDGQDNAITPSRILALQRQAPGIVFNPSPMQRGSFLTFDQLLEGVFEADALIYPIHLKVDEVVMRPPGNRPSGGLEFRVQVQTEMSEISSKQLEELADASGGKLFPAERIEDLKGVYEQVAAELRTIYSIAYTPKNFTADGKFRRLRVKVGKADAAVRTRRGYYTK